MFAWLRHKLFGTEFVRVQYGYGFYLRKVRRSPEGILYAIVWGEPIPLKLHDNMEYIYPMYVWVYKNKRTEVNNG